MPFQKGQSGNPGGRPKVIAELRDLGRQRTPDAIERLVKIVRKGKNDSAAVAAAQHILVYGWGKPVQPVEGKIDHTHRHGPDLSMLSTDDLLKLQRILKQIEEPKPQVIEHEPLAIAGPGDDSELE